MATINATTLTLTIIGGLNWLLLGLFNFNLVAFVFGAQTAGSRIIYIVVGICALYCLSMFRSVTNRRAAIDMSYASERPSRQF